MLGVANCNPKLYQNLEPFITDNKELLKKAIGERMTEYFIIWSCEFETWWNDGPVIFRIGDVQFEFVAHLSDFGLSVNQIDVSQEIDWCGAGKLIPLEWKKNEFMHVNQLLDHKISSIDCVYFQHDKENLLYGIQFGFEIESDVQYLMIYNWGDELGYEIRATESKPGFQIERI